MIGLQGLTMIDSIYLYDRHNTESLEHIDTVYHTANTAYGATKMVLYTASSNSKLDSEKPSEVIRFVTKAFDGSSMHLSVERLQDEVKVSVHIHTFGVYETTPIGLSSYIYAKYIIEVVPKLLPTLKARYRDEERPAPTIDVLAELERFIRGDKDADT